MAQGYPGLCFRALPLLAGSHPAGKRLYFQACMAGGGILPGLDPESEQSFQGLIDHLSFTFQSCKTVSSLIGDFYNWSQKAHETEDMFVDKLQVLVHKDSSSQTRVLK